MESAYQLEASWALAATCRCLTEDLSLSPTDCELPVVELIDRHQVLADFVTKRIESPIGGEMIRSLQHKKVIAYSLHRGRGGYCGWVVQLMGWLAARPISDNGFQECGNRVYRVTVGQESEDHSGRGALPPG